MLAAFWPTLMAVGLAFQPSTRPDAQPQERLEVVKVLIWYSKSDPLGTFAYRVYDAHKPQSIAAVEAWVRMVHERYPSYEAYLRPYDLTLARGDGAQAKVAGLMSRELMVLAAYYYNLDFGAAPSRALTRESPHLEHRALRPLPPMFPSPGSGAYASPAYRVPNAAPFPYPYVRPHP